MPHLPEERAALYEFALLALSLAHGIDDHLSAFELESLSDRLYRHHPGWTQREVHDVVQDALHTYTAAPDRWERARQACVRLAQTLGPSGRQQALDDLLQIARADGLVLEAEKQFVAKIASFWHAAAPHLPEGWTLLHDLVYLNLALALGADEDLTAREMATIRQAVASGPLAPLDQESLSVVIRETLQFYTNHREGVTREAAANRLGNALAPEQRTTILASLIEVANADDRFLDTEEDFINGLVMAWDVDPGVLYDPPEGA